MKQIDIEQFKQTLEFQRKEATEFLTRLGREAHALDSDCGQDEADRCVVSMSKESLFEQSSKRRTALRLIEAALRRIADGSFGVCVACGDDIQSRRLKAVPWTQFCLPCQEEIEAEVGANLATRDLVRTEPVARRAG
jgi:RNA polymerase-binding transcription factor